MSPPHAALYIHIIRNSHPLYPPNIGRLLCSFRRNERGKLMFEYLYLWSICGRMGGRRGGMR